MLTVEEQIKLIADAAMDALDLDTAAERRAAPGETILDLPVADTSSPVQFTEEVVTMIDVKTADPTEPRQKRPIRVVVAGILAAAAAIVAVAFVVIRDADDVTPGHEPSPTVTVLPTTPPRALPEGTAPGGKALLPGTYFVDEVGGTPTPRIFFTIGEGWWDRSAGSGVITRGDFDNIGFSHPGVVFSDACHWSDGDYPGSVATVDGLVAALSEQGGWADVTVPSDISIDGYAGKAFQRTAPADMSDCDIKPGFHPRNTDPGGSHPLFQSWWREEGDLRPIEADSAAGSAYEPGTIETLWVLDLDGTIVVINTRPVLEASPAAQAELAAVLDSIRVAVPPTPLPRALPETPREPFVPGTYFVGDVEGTPTPRISFTLGSGWWDRTTGKGVISRDISGDIAFSQPGVVFSDACRWSEGYRPGPVSTVDSLVTALSEQGGWADVTAPSDISIDGYAGKAFQRTAPADMSDCDTMRWGPRSTVAGVYPAFRSWQREEGDLTPITGGNLAGSFYEPGEVETLWVLDLDGTVVVINTRPVPEASAADRAEFAAVLDSIRIEQT